VSNYKNNYLTVFSYLTFTLLSLAGCSHVGPPPEPAQVKAMQKDALSFLKALPPASKRDLAVCHYSISGIRNVAGEIVPYDEFSSSVKTIQQETFIALSRPAKRQYLAIPTSAGSLNNECIAYRYVKQKTYAFYWGKDSKSQRASDVLEALTQLGVKHI